MTQHITEIMSMKMQCCALVTPKVALMLAKVTLAVRRFPFKMTNRYSAVLYYGVLAVHELVSTVSTHEQAATLIGKSIHRKQSIHRIFRIRNAINSNNFNAGQIK